MLIARKYGVAAKPQPEATPHVRPLDLQCGSAAVLSPLKHPGLQRGIFLLQRVTDESSVKEPCAVTQRTQEEGCEPNIAQPEF